MTEYEACPNCETDLLVSGCKRQHLKFICHGCNLAWNESEKRYTH